ncbi:MAG: protein kinase [Deltaproteobacteria bacterium]|nr:protein kinase [Deltaproteobacteria bacterium]
MAKCPACQAEVADGAKFCTLCGAKLPRAQSAAEDPLLGRIFARNFRIEKLLGVGGMGKVYRATQLSLDKPVVLKLLHSHYAHDETLVARFHREARAASRLNHPNSINIIDFGQEDDGTLFMAMEFLQGRDLFTVLQNESPVPEYRVARIVRQVCSALAEAHDQGVIHRDLKPENIMVEDRPHQKDYVKVLDFGIAKIQGPEGKDARTLTAQGMVCGTPEYMAPEQARGEVLDARADIYAVGVLMYQLVTGQLPFQADNAIGIVTKHIVEKPRPPREVAPDRAISPEIEAIVLRCMAKKREERFQSIIELSDALEPIAARGSVSPAMSSPPVVVTEGMPAAGTMSVDRAEPRPRSSARSGTAVAVGIAVSFAALAGAVFIGNWAYQQHRQRVQGLAALAPDAAAAAASSIDSGAGGASGDAGAGDSSVAVVVGGGAHAVVRTRPDGGVKALRTPDAGGATEASPRRVVLSKTDRRAIEELLKAAQLKINTNFFDEGRDKCYQVLKMDPANAEAHYHLANAAFKESRFVESCTEIKKYIALKRPRLTAQVKRIALNTYCPGQ